MAMSGGLLAGYGTLAVWAGRYLFPSQRNARWMFVTPANQLPPGEAMSFTSPTGLRVVITRKADSPAEGPAGAEDFLALSSTCPHLGCRVHWEPHNERFFCPCHNGAFDAQGHPTAGPPKADNQHLPSYPLKLEGGLLYIEMPFAPVVEPERNTMALAARTGDSSHVTPVDRPYDTSGEA